MITIKVKEQNTGVVVKDWGIAGIPTDMEYGRVCADLLAPYLHPDENGEYTLVELVADVETKGYTPAHVTHRLTTALRKNGVVVFDTDPIENDSDVFDSADEIPDVFLEFVDPNASEYGANKWYRLKEHGTWKVGATYGRHGAKAGERWATHAEKPYVYHSYMYFIKLEEKIAKGYVDQTKNRLLATPKNEGKVDLSGLDPKVEGLVKALMDFADKTIKENYSVTAETVNLRAIKTARSILKKMEKVKKVTTFNKYLVEVFKIIPRKMRMVASYTADHPNEFQTILQKENDLLNVLETKVKGLMSKRNGNGAATGILNALGLEIYPANAAQMSKITNRLRNTAVPGKIKNVYRVINKKTQAAFDKYLETHDYPKVMELWHGSTNCNWWSIMHEGLKVHSGAQTTGKMFGYGIYFAPSPMKSWGYTSGYGSYWASGSSHTAFMGVFATAHNTPADVHQYDSSLGSLDADSFEARFPGCDCLYCHRDQGMLRNDEIVLYREEQLTINYLVEFEI